MYCSDHHFYGAICEGANSTRRGALGLFGGCFPLSSECKDHVHLFNEAVHMGERQGNVIFVVVTELFEGRGNVLSESHQPTSLVLTRRCEEGG